MAEHDAGVLIKAVTEIKYARGVVYLDRCGSLMLQLQDVVGSNFRPNVPQMDFAQLDNALERIVVVFGRERLRVEHTGPASGARIEKLTAECWDCVADSLGVRSCVERFAVRIFNVWPTPHLEEARRLIRKTGFAQTAGFWDQAFGEPSYAGVAATTLTERGHTRRSLDEVEHAIEGVLPEGFAQFFPRAGVQYDVDYVLKPKKLFGLKRDQVREFVRSGWNSFQADRAKVASALALGADLQ